MLASLTFRKDGRNCFNAELTWIDFIVQLYRPKWMQIIYANAQQRPVGSLGLIRGNEKVQLVRSFGEMRKSKGRHIMDFLKHIFIETFRAFPIEVDNRWQVRISSMSFWFVGYMYFVAAIGPNISWSMNVTKIKAPRLLVLLFCVSYKLVGAEAIWHTRL